MAPTSPPPTRPAARPPMGATDAGPNEIYLTGPGANAHPADVHLTAAPPTRDITAIRARRHRGGEGASSGHRPSRRLTRPRPAPVRPTGRPSPVFAHRLQLVLPTPGGRPAGEH